MYLWPVWCLKHSLFVLYPYYPPPQKKQQKTKVVTTTRDKIYLAGIKNLKLKGNYCIKCFETLNPGGTWLHLCRCNFINGNRGCIQFFLGEMSRKLKHIRKLYAFFHLYNVPGTISGGGIKPGTHPPNYDLDGNTVHLPKLNKYCYLP